MWQHQQVSPSKDIPYSPSSIAGRYGCFDQVIRGKKLMQQQRKSSKKELSHEQQWFSRVEVLRTCSPTLLNDEEFELGFYSERFTDDPWKELTSSLENTSSLVHTQLLEEKEGEIKLDS